MYTAQYESVEGVVMKEDIEFSDEYRDFDEELESMIADLPALKGRLDAFINRAAEQFGSRKFRRQMIQGEVAHNAGFLAKRANSQDLSAAQRQRYIELLRGLWKLVPLIRKAHVKIPGVLKTDLAKFGPEGGEHSNAHEGSEAS